MYHNERTDIQYKSPRKEGDRILLVIYEREDKTAFLLENEDLARKMYAYLSDLWADHIKSRSFQPRIESLEFYGVSATIDISNITRITLNEYVPLDEQSLPYVFMGGTPKENPPSALN